MANSAVDTPQLLVAASTRCGHSRPACSGCRRSRLRGIYRRQFAESRRERLFLASVGFFTAALVIRGLTLAIHHNVGPFHDVSMHGRHIHHLVWGILLLLFVGYCWLLEIGTGRVPSPAWTGRLTSMLYGIAAALTLDEFALWLNLRDVYWQREGRESVEAMAVFAGSSASASLEAHSSDARFRKRFTHLIGNEARPLKSSRINPLRSLLCALCHSRSASPDRGLHARCRQYSWALSQFPDTAPESAPNG